jgi:hypothetical protein
MACDLTAGRAEVCKETVGGLQAVYFIDFVSGSTFTRADEVITDGFTGLTAYKYELKGTSAYTETVNSSRENGTTFFSQELTLNLKKLTNEMTTELKLLAYSRPQIIVHTNAGDALLVGQDRGADLTAGSISTGGALGDLYGYSITMTAEERLPAGFISGSTVSNPFAAVTAPTIVTS